VSRVAVIGANGFIGRRLVEQWHLEGVADVVPIVRRPEAAVDALRFGISCRVADAMDERALAEALDGCAAAVHAGAGDRRFVRHSGVSVARAAERAGVGQIIYLSSMAVHGWNAPPGTDESSPLSQRQALPYNAWKVQAERALSRLCCERGIRLVILRPGIVYGPRSQWVLRFARALLDGRAYVVDGGRGVCNAVYVDNLAFAIGLALERTDLAHEAFLINDEETITWRQFYEPVCRALGWPWDAVHDVAPRARRRSWRQRYVAARDARGTQALLAHVPLRARYALSQAVDAWLDGSAAGGRESETEHRQRPEADHEMSLLQTCTYRFPIDKARRLLGYVPPVSFDEACRRTLGWLQFAGHPLRGVM
jgi:2-alkyl-3-oxoalkanoate reductase